MTLLLAPEAVGARRIAAAGPLRGLADSLAADLEPLTRGEPFIPEEKARLTRAGGRCPRDGALLEFDPYSPHRHRCPVCRAEMEGDEHYRAWIMWYQLWLAERGVHAATLALLRGDDRHRALAVSVLSGYANGYDRYPNRDNVLGPSRLFFSTYLESIWLLQICTTISFLEATGAAPGICADARARIVEPSAAMITSYDEGMSNRQVWNSAALLAAALLLGQPTVAERLVNAPSGLVAQLRDALLADGTWYEGENYHVFAHRGLWYAVTLAERAGIPLPPTLVARFHAGFAAPFVTALPDFTIPSRRDSQYAISLRQWRFAELCELGLAREVDAGTRSRLVQALAVLYDGTATPGETGRAHSAAEAERHYGACRLTRADLGWRALLHARPEPPPLPARAAGGGGGALLDAQGFAVMRRHAGRVYVALDYGHSGGGHGHADRLNLLLCDGDARWLDDYGTGSYVDASLHWYRSTLAHNAPVVNRRSQRRVHGELLAHEDRGGAGWVRARAAGLARGVSCVRTVVALDDYLVDVLDWVGGGPDAKRTTMDLPLHAGGTLRGVSEWEPGNADGGEGLEDGYDAVRDVRVARPVSSEVRLEATRGERAALAFILAPPGASWWRALAPGAPGSGDAEFHWVRCEGSQGSIVTVWSWTSRVAGAAPGRDGQCVEVTLVNGERHVHSSAAGGRSWHIDLLAGGARSSIDLGGAREAPDEPRAAQAVATSSTAPAEGAAYVIPHALRARDRRWTGAAACTDDDATLRFLLGEAHYRRTEEPWRSAGAPTADVVICADGLELDLSIAVHKTGVHFAPREARERLDNEDPAINSDGVQLHFVAPAREPHVVGWTLVPELGDGVRVTPHAGSPKVSISTAWSLTPTGYVLRCALPLTVLGVRRGDRFWMDVAINEMPADRERRRGQLVLSGGWGEFLYLRGDRLDPSRFLPFVCA